MENNVKKYFLPLNDIPFERIKSLEGFNYKYVQCIDIRIDEYFEEYASIISVQNSFHSDKKGKFKDDSGVLFGPVLSQYLSTRAKIKCILKEKYTKKIMREELPHLKYTSGKRNHPDGNWFYTKNGDYFVFSAIRTTYNQAKHLEGISIYCDWLLKLRVVLELLKINIKKGLVTLNEIEIKDIAYSILQNEPALSNANESELHNAVNLWVPSMMSVPLIEDIPQEFIGRVIE